MQAPSTSRVTVVPSGSVLTIPPRRPRLRNCHCSAVSSAARASTRAESSASVKWAP